MPQLEPWPVTCPSNLYSVLPSFGLVGHFFLLIIVSLRERGEEHWMCIRTWLLTLGGFIHWRIAIVKVNFSYLELFGRYYLFFPSSAASLEPALRWRERPRLNRLDRASIHIQRFFRDVIFGQGCIGLESLYIKLTSLVSIIGFLLHLLFLCSMQEEGWRSYIVLLLSQKL